MSNPIDRQMAIDAVSNWLYDGDDKRSVDQLLSELPSAQPESAKEYCEECNHIEMCRWYPYEGCEFRSLPTAQPERIRGKWNTYYHGGVDFSYSCARCGYGAPFDMKGGKVYQKKWNYCPNCGAWMGEGDE